MIVSQQSNVATEVCGQTLQRSTELRSGTTLCRGYDVERIALQRPANPHTLRPKSVCKGNMDMRLSPRKAFPLLGATFLTWLALVAGGGALAEGTADVAKSGFDHVLLDDELKIFLDGNPIATYCWNDPTTTRPYFKHLKSADGKTQLTRNFPPVDGDFDDHGTYHPGVWWGFGDIGGNDYWRMKAKIVGGDFTQQPAVVAGRFRFAVRNRLMTNAGDAQFCEQHCRFTMSQAMDGILLICESTFVRDESAFWLGDQEEMGLAFRVATPLTVKKGGRILDSAGRTELKAIRTHQSDWCDYSGVIAGQFGGIMLMNDPANFRKPWWHAVDTGLLVANPLGESELHGRGKKRENVLVGKGESFRLRYGCLLHLHTAKEKFDPPRAYSAFLKEIATLDRN